MTKRPFCRDCGARTQRAIPPGEDRERDVCAACGLVFYSNPTNVVGCVIVDGSRTLLCKRGIQPARGTWTPPAGYHELGESLAQGAARETWEEAGARVEVVRPHSFLDLPHIGQCHIFFIARLLAPTGDDPAFSAGPESLDVRWFEVEEIPWHELAFPVTRFALELWADDLRQGRAAVHAGSCVWDGGGSRYDYANYELTDHIATPLSSAQARPS